MKIHLFDLKSFMEREGIRMMDFLENNFSVNYDDPELQIQSVMFIEDRHLCRPDLLSWENYYSVDYVDIILKFNQISNPFSMQIDDFIVIPTLSSGVRFYQEDKLKTSKYINDTKALFIDPTKASQKDLARLKQLEKIAGKRKNGSSEIKPTNLLRANERPFVADGREITFAPSISNLSTQSQTKN